MRTPRLKFQLNQKLDLTVALNFRNVKAGGIDFRRSGILKPHSELKTGELTKKRLNNFIVHFYFAHQKELSQTLKRISEEWRKTSKMFFVLTKKLFKNHSFPKGKYICYLSIWNINPRDLHEKTFQLYYKTKLTKETIIHEMLHFIFFDFLYKNFPRLNNKKYYPAIWALSEAFNVVIQNQLEWRRLLKTKKEMPYPQHRQLVNRLNKFWCKDKSVINLIKREFADKN